MPSHKNREPFWPQRGVNSWSQAFLVICPLVLQTEVTQKAPTVPGAPFTGQGPPHSFITQEDRSPGRPESSVPGQAKPEGGCDGVGWPESKSLIHMEVWPCQLPVFSAMQKEYKTLCSKVLEFVTYTDSYTHIHRPRNTQTACDTYIWCQHKQSSGQKPCWLATGQ